MTSSSKKSDKQFYRRLQRISEVLGSLRENVNNEDEPLPEYAMPAAMLYIEKLQFEKWTEAQFAEAFPAEYTILQREINGA